MQCCHKVSTWRIWQNLFSIDVSQVPICVNANERTMIWKCIYRYMQMMQILYLLGWLNYFLFVSTISIINGWHMAEKILKKALSSAKWKWTTGSLFFPPCYYSTPSFEGRGRETHLHSLSRGFLRREDKATSHCKCINSLYLLKNEGGGHNGPKVVYAEVTILVDQKAFFVTRVPLNEVSVKRGTTISYFRQSHTLSQTINRRRKNLPPNIRLSLVYSGRNQDNHEKCEVSTIYSFKIKFRKILFPTIRHTLYSF